MARRNKHSLVEIKEMVFNAAETIILDEGYAALTIRKIAMEMGYTVGSVYMFFASRAELVLHLNARTLEDICTQLKPFTVTGDSAAWLKAYLTYIHSNNQRWRMIFAHTHDDDMESSLPAWYQAHLDALWQQFSSFFVITTVKQPPQLVQAVWQGIQGICLLSSKEDMDTAALLLLNSVVHEWQCLARHEEH